VTECKLFFVGIDCLQIQEYDFCSISQGELYPAVILRSSARNTVCVCVQDADNWKFLCNSTHGGLSSALAMPHSQVPNVTYIFPYMLDNYETIYKLCRSFNSLPDSVSSTKH